MVKADFPRPAQRPGRGFPVARIVLPLTIALILVAVVLGFLGPLPLR